MKWDKAKVAAVLSVVLTAVVALLAVFGYDVSVIQPREELLPLMGGSDAGIETWGGTTNLNALAVDSVTASGAVAAGSFSTSGTAGLGATTAASLSVTGLADLDGKLIQSSTAITVTDTQEITPAYSMYLLSAAGNLAITLAAPSAAGQVLYLYGDDNVTVTINDTNIRSTDGNAVTIGQYDVVEFLSTATEWIHVAKSANS